MISEPTRATGIKPIAEFNISNYTYTALLGFRLCGLALKQLGFPQGVFIFPLKESAKMKRDVLLDQVDAWVRAAAVVASYARGSSNSPFMTPSEMSEYLRLRWFMSSGRIEVALEQNRETSDGNHWLGSFSIGGFDPYLLTFRRIDTLTEDDMAAAEEMVKATFPQIAVTRCHFCEGHLTYENKEGVWICLECLDLLPLKQANTFGYVYIFGSKTEGRYKIGQGTTPKARMSDYRKKLPFPVEMIHVIPADNKIKAEADLHHQLRANRESGEWFRLSPDELKSVTNLRGYNQGLWLMAK